jgi:hypothetical protein
MHRTPESRPRRQSGASRNRQQGFFALAVCALLGILVTMLVMAYAQETVAERAAANTNAQVLAQARAALLTYAINYREFTGNSNEVYGVFPCPDMGTTGNAADEGVAQSGCGSKDVTAIGRLPWKTLGLPPLKDQDGECLWYAVSGNFKNTPKSDLINWDSNGLIEIMAADGTSFVAGSSATGRVVAVIFAPGAALTGQDRTSVAHAANCGGNYTVANYLDQDAASSINNATGTSGTANALSRYIAATNSDLTQSTSDSFNDQLVYVSPSDVFANGLQKRTDFQEPLSDVNGMLRKVADCLVDYGSTNSAGTHDIRMPWAAPLTLPSSVYGSALAYDDGQATAPANKLYTGRLPYVVNNSATETVNNKYGADDILLEVGKCPGWTAAEMSFWEAYKDQVYYAVAPAFSAYDNVYWSSPDPCGAGGTCFTVDGVSDIAAVVIFAGSKQAGQNRNNNTNPSYASTDRNSTSNFLESTNLSMIQTSPTSTMARSFSKLAGNDTVMCIRKDAGGLYVDPTCGKTANCNTDGDLLSAYRSGSTNTCKTTSGGVATACQTLSTSLNRNNCSCQEAARVFVSKDCLQGFTSTKCTTAQTTLTACG